MTGAGAAVLASSVAFALAWGVILLRLRRVGPQRTVTSAERKLSPGGSIGADGEARVALERDRGASRCR